MLIRFDSLAAAADAFANAQNRGRGHDSWSGESREEALQYLRIGNDAVVPDAERMIREFEGAVQVTRAEWTPSVFGAYPIVPEFLAGEPESMRRMAHQQSDRSPVRVFAGIVASGGVEWKDMRKRGTAILALVMALSQIRPVELHVFGELYGTKDGSAVYAIKLDTAPLDVARAAYALASQGWVRGLMFDHARQHHGFDGSWAYHSLSEDLIRNPKSSHRQRIAAQLGAQPQDLVIPPVFLTDELIRDPLSFVRRALKEHSDADGE